MIPEEFELRAKIKRKETGDTINIYALKMKYGPKGIIWRGILKCLEEEMEKKDDKIVKQAYQNAINHVKQILGII